MAAELDFTLSLVDRLTKPLKQTQAALTGFADKTEAAFRRVGGGAIALWGVNKAVMGMLRPAYDLQDALDDLTGTGFEVSGLNKVTQAANDFAIEYGRSSLEFVKNTALVRRSIGGITNNELPRYTQAASILGVAMRTSTDDAVNYLSHVAAAFPQLAEKMGKVKFAESMAGLAAQMKNTFGTTLADLSGMIEQSKGTGGAMGVSLAEQLAVMGTARRTLGGGASGAYDQLLRHIGDGGATKATGINFRDAGGQILPIITIMDKLKARYGENIESNAAAQASMEKAFGKGASVVRALWHNTGDLSKSLEALGKNPGMKAVEEMAKKTVVPWEQFAAILEAIRAEISLRLLPTFGPFFDSLVNCGKEFVNWLDAFPNIARWIGYLSMSMLALAAIGAINNIIMGTFSFIATGLKPLIKGLGWALNLKARYMTLAAFATEYYEKVMKKLRGTLAGTSMMFDALGASELFALWPVLAIGAAIALLVVAVIKFWQPIKAFFSGFIQGFSDAFESVGPLHDILGPVGSLFSMIWQQVKALAGWFGDLLSPIQFSDDALKGATDTGVSFGRFVAEAVGWILTPIKIAVGAFNFLMDAINIVADAGGKIWDAFDSADIAGSLKRIKGIFTDTFDQLWNALKTQFAGVFNSMIGMLNKIPGVNIDLMEVAPTTPATLTTGQRATPVPGGPVGSQIASGKGGSVSHDNRSVNIQNLNVDTMPTPGQLAEYSELVTG
ncbi:TPA: phage tail tape measure protein [Salmonella enterica]|uniref:Phage tail tape measure protein n=1 Tax=Salmonella enterica TaxID=28901 RepID=A0A756I358_SALER|nr:phage tail tape measure protein [Salmonella enterica]